jgi:hypothetical protein
MRELTKSTFSAGLAMSLFGMQTMMNAIRRPQPGGANPAQDGLDTVTQAIVDNTGVTMREAFQAGDKIQRTLVDLAFQFMTLAPLRSGGSSSTMTDMTRQATERLRTWMGDMSGARQPGCGCRGAAQPRPWTGPAPPPSQPAAAATPGTAWGPMPDQP